jgi:hypothetical protein
MKIGEKLFPGSIVALLLGVFLAAPLLCTNVAMAPDTGVSGSFAVDVVYAYIERRNITISADAYYLPPSTNPNDTIEIQTVQDVIGINFTRLSEEIVPCDARIEVYLIKVYSDKGFIGNLQRHTGIIYNSDLVGDPMYDDLTEFFGNRSPSGGGSVYNHWNVGESRLGCSSGSGTNWVPTFGDPETIFISVNLLGWITINGDSRETIVLSEPEVVAEAQLEKFGDGFLYNTIIPEDELSDIDPINPIGKLFELMGNSN